MSNSTTQSTVLTVTERLLQVQKSKERLEQLTKDYGHLVGHNQRKITGRNYFGAEDIPKFDDETILLVCEEVEEYQKETLSSIFDVI